MKSLDQLFDGRDIEERRSGGLRAGDGGNFLEAQLGALFRFRFRKGGGLSLGEFVEFGVDIAIIAL